MSAKSDQIDLNSDAVLVDQENEGDGVSLSEPTVRVGVSEPETLEGSFNCQGQVQEPEVDPFRDFRRDNDPAGSFCGSDFGGSIENVGREAVGDGLELKMVAEDRGIDVEADIGRMDTVTDTKAGGDGYSLMGSEAEANTGRNGDDISVGDEKEVKACQSDETHSGEVNDDCNANLCPVVEISDQETSSTLGLSSIPVDANKVQNADASGSLPGNGGMEVTVSDTDCPLPKKSPIVCTHDFEMVSSDGMDNQGVQVDIQAENKGNESMIIHVPEAEVSQNTGSESNVFSLVVDLNSYTSPGRNAISDALAVSKPEFCISELVWGKVRSHPWWPGQIFDPSAASKKAKKYFKKESYLIAYFGDQTFAWNEASRIRPFRTHFSQMEKQSNLEDFRYAVDCTLEEVSRRVEFGLACSCIPEEVYAKIKTQMMVNAGIQEESSRRDGGDHFSSAVSFETVKLVDHVKTLAQLPFGGVDRLEFVTAQAQLLAFYRWKGYSELPELKMLGGLMESDAEIPLPGEVKHCSELNEIDVSDVKAKEQVPSGKGKSKGQDGSYRKRKHISEDSMYPSKKDSMYPSKKEKSLSDLMAERRSYTPNGKSGSDSKASHELFLSSSGNKGKAVDTISNDSAVKHWKSQLSIGAANKVLQSKQTFSVGDSILRVACQLNGSSPLLKPSDEMSPKPFDKHKSKNEALSEKSQTKSFILTANSSPDEMLSQLCLAARDPMKGYSFLISIVSFFLEFRNSVSLDCPSSQKHEQFPELVSGVKTRKRSTKSENTRISESERLKDSYWTDRIIQCIPEEQSSLANQNAAREFLPETPNDEDMPTVEPQSDVQWSSYLDSEQQNTSENLDLEAMKPVGHLEQSGDEGLSPTALILNFTDLDSVPSEANLNKIFSRFGTLNQLETEVLKNSRAKVVFWRRADAEAAFSSAGKYSIFGPSLVSYRLRYMSPRKASLNATKRRRKDATSVGGNAA